MGEGRQGLLRPRMVKQLSEDPASISGLTVRAGFPVHHRRDPVHRGH